MRAHLLPDIFSFLNDIRPQYGRPTLIFLGGSQVVDGGIHKAQNSDHDVLVIFPQIDVPESFVFTSPDGVRSYDLILRDSRSMAYDILQAHQDGKGTLLNIAALSLPLYDPEGRANSFQALIRYHYTRGPDLLHPDDFEGECHSLESNLRDLHDEASFTASLLAISNRMAKDALRFAGGWTGNGKIAGRYLQKGMPDFCGTLIQSFHTAAQALDPEPLRRTLTHDLPFLFGKGNKRIKPIAAPHISPTFNSDPDDLGEATTSARINLDALAAYVRSGNGLARDAASTWIHMKLGNLAKPLTPERFIKKPEEYFFALGRAISGIADVHAAQELSKPSELSMTVRIQSLFARQSALSPAVDKALEGHPESLCLLFDRALGRVAHPPLPFLHRPSRADMMADPALIVPDSWVF